MFLRLALLLINLPIFYVALLSIDRYKDFFGFALVFYIVEFYLVYFWLKRRSKRHLLPYLMIGNLISVFGILWSIGEFEADLIWVYVVTQIIMLFPFKASRSSGEGDLGSVEAAGEFGEERFKQVVREMIGISVDGFITSGNIVHRGRNFEIDCLVLVPKFGLVLVEVKHYSGHLLCTSEDHWQQQKPNGDIKEIGNASRQVMRTERLLRELLQSGGLDRWPILSVVALTHDNVSLEYGWHDKSPQTNIVHYQSFPRFVQDLPYDDSVVFTREDFDALNAIIKDHEQEYVAATDAGRAVA